MTVAPKPGWYPDPAGADDLYRWWDGATWSDATSDSAHAAAPKDDRADFDHSSELSPRRSPTRAVLAVTLGFALFISTGIGAGLLFWHDSPAPAAGGAGSSPLGRVASTTATPAVGRLDQSLRKARIGSAAMTLPADPYQTYGDPMKIAGVFDVFFVASVVVHGRYDGRRDWSAVVAFAQLSASLTADDDLEKAGQAAVTTLANHFYDGHPTTVKPISYSDRSVDGNPGMLFTVAVHYSIKKLPSTYDRVTALVVRLDDGSLVAAISSVPDDADAEVVRLAAESLESLTIS